MHTKKPLKRIIHVTELFLITNLQLPSNLFNLIRHLDIKLFKEHKSYVYSYSYVRIVIMYIAEFPLDKNLTFRIFAGGKAKKKKPAGGSRYHQGGGRS